MAPQTPADPDLTPPEARKCRASREVPADALEALGCLRCRVDGLNLFPRLGRSQIVGPRSRADATGERTSNLCVRGLRPSRADAT
jgi:hypothetical protein